MSTAATCLSSIEFELRKPSDLHFGWWSIEEFPQLMDSENDSGEYPYLFLCSKKMNELFGIPDDIKKIGVHLYKVDSWKESDFYTTDVAGKIIRNKNRPSSIPVKLILTDRAIINKYYLLIQGVKTNVCPYIVNWVKSVVKTDDIIYVEVECL